VEREVKETLAVGLIVKKPARIGSQVSGFESYGSEDWSVTIPESEVLPLPPGFLAGANEGADYRK